MEDVIGRDVDRTNVCTHISAVVTTATSNVAYPSSDWKQVHYASMLLPF